MKTETIKYNGFTACLPVEGDETYPLLVHYDGQSKPQNAYLEICPENKTELHATFNGEIGNAVTMWHWHGRELHVDIPNTARARDIRNFVEKNAELIARIVAGYSTDWDGNNTVGVLDNDAAEALEELRNEAEDSGWWTEPEAEDFDVNGDLIENWVYTLVLSDYDSKAGELTMEEKGPYKSGTLFSDWERDEAGVWHLVKRRGWTEEENIDWGEMDQEQVQKLIAEVATYGAAETPCDWRG